MHWLWLLLPLGLAGNIVLAMLSRGPELVGSLRSASASLLALAAAMCFVPWFCNALRLRIWTGFLGRSLTYAQCLRISLISELGAAASPTASGGGPFKAGLLMEHGFGTAQAVSLMLLGSLEDGLLLLPLVTTAAAVSPSGRMVVGAISRALANHRYRILIVVGLSTSVIALLWILARFGKYSLRFRKLSEKVRDFGHQIVDCFRIIAGPGRVKFWTTMPLAALQWGCRYTALAVILAALGISSNPIDIFLLQWTTFTLMNLIPTPGAAGGAELSFIFIHRMVVPHSLLPLAAAGWRLMTYYLPVSVAVMIVTAKSIKISTQKFKERAIIESSAGIGANEVS